ncbi:pantothenate synthetase, partial [Striga asiatica]
MECCKKIITRIRLIKKLKFAVSLTFLFSACVYATWNIVDHEASCFYVNISKFGGKGDLGAYPLGTIEREPAKKAIGWARLIAPYVQLEMREVQAVQASSLASAPGYTRHCRVLPGSMEVQVRKQVIHALAGCSGGFRWTRTTHDYMVPILKRLYWI